jgi:FAD-dependent oxidoreductase family protein
MSFSRRMLLGGGGATAVGALAFGDYEAAYAAGETYTLEELEAQVVVIGGGVGGVAAALGALRNGATVVLTESTDWIGGQFTTQLVPPDEHRWIEPNAGAYGQTATYKNLRAAVRQYYKTYYPVTAAFKSQNQPNPGNAWVSRLAADPAVWRVCLWNLLLPYVAAGKLEILLGHTPQGASVENGRITSVRLVGPDGVARTVSGSYVVEATEFGDLLPLAGADSVVGREAGGPSGTNELHNTNPAADPIDQQCFTMVLALGYNRAGGDHRIGKQPAYRKYRASFQKFFADNLFDPRRDYPFAEGPNYWQYRRVATLTSFLPNTFSEEVSLINYPCNDFKTGNLLDVTETERRENIQAGKELSLCLLYYLQNEIPHPDDDGHGYPALRPRQDVSGTLDGVAKVPYIREARRMLGFERIYEWQVGVDNRVALLGKPAEELTAADFPDTVGAGHYWIDIHPGPKNQYGLWTRCYPYQIPLSAMLSRNIDNLLAGGKTISATHVTNGAYRLHPTEWNVGESAGVLAAYCVAHHTDPRSVWTSRLNDLQNLLRAQGVQTHWPDSARNQWFKPPARS